MRNEESEPVRPPAEVAAERMRMRVRAALDAITTTYLALAEQSLAESIALGDEAEPITRTRRDS